MKPFKSYDQAQVLAEAEKLPPGGYIIGILEANELSYEWGSVLEVKFDIAKGEFKNFYTNQYKNSQMENNKYKGSYRMNIPKDDGSDLDNFTARKFKTDIKAIEDSNPGYHWDWDETKLKGKKVGALFFEKEYDFEGRQGFFTTVHSLKPMDIITGGKFKIPKPKLLNKTGPASFTDIGKDSMDEDLPF